MFIYFFNDILFLLKNVIYLETVVVVIVWELDLQLPMQSVPTTTEVVSSNPVHGEVDIA